MNQKLTKKVFIVCAIAALAMSPIAAQSRGNRNDRDDWDDRYERDDRDDWDDRYDNDDWDDLDDRFEHMMPRLSVPRVGLDGDTVLMGTVRTVDAEAGIFSVRDADGNTTSVHVNPLTRIVRAPQPPAPPEPAADGTTVTPPAPPAPPARLDISSITEGAFVTVRDFNTGTETLEASSVVILSEAPGV